MSTSTVSSDNRTALRGFNRLRSHGMELDSLTDSSMRIMFLEVVRLGHLKESDLEESRTQRELGLSPKQCITALEKLSIWRFVDNWIPRVLWSLNPKFWRISEILLLERILRGESIIISELDEVDEEAAQCLIYMYGIVNDTGDYDPLTMDLNYLFFLEEVVEP